MAGYPTDMTAINNRAGQVAKAMRDVLTDVQHMKAFFDTKTDAELEALGYTAQEVAVLKSAYTQLDQLRLVATGQAEQVGANNFLYFSNQLLGVQ